MKHDDTTLQAAIDAAMLETRKNNSCKSLAACKKSWPKSWRKESPARLALAKSFLAKLPEAQPSMDLQQLAGEKGSSQAIKEVQKYASTLTVEGINGLLKGIQECLPEPILADDGRSLGQVAEKAYDNALSRPSDVSHEHCMEAAAQAVASVVLAQAIRRLEKVTVMEVEGILREAWLERGGWFRSAAEAVRARLIAAARGEAVGINGLTEAELVALKSSPIGILRPLPEAGPVPDGCVRLTTYKSESANCGWLIGEGRSTRDTHFTDIRLPRNETEAADPYARLKAYAKAGARIRFKHEFGWSEWFVNEIWDWTQPPEKYEVHPDDLHLVPEYATVNEQPKQQVPLGPEDCPPGSIVTNSANSWYKVQYVTAGGVRTDLQGSKLINYEELKTYGWSINTSLPDTGRWDANAWKPCYKLI